MEEESGLEEDEEEKEAPLDEKTLARLADERRRIDELQAKLKAESEQRAAERREREAAERLARRLATPVTVTVHVLATGEFLTEATMVRGDLVRDLVKVVFAQTMFPGRPRLSFKDTGKALQTGLTLDAEGVADNPHLLADLCPTVVTTSEDGTARLWDTSTGVCEAIFRGHEAVVYSAAFAPNCRSIATASEDCTARVWNLETEACDKLLEGHTGAVFAACFSHDGRLIVTASDDKTARVWTFKTGLCNVVLRAHSAPIFQAVFSPEDSGSDVVQTFALDSSSRLWDAKSGICMRTLHGEEAKFSVEYAASFTPNGKQHVVALGGMTAELRATNDGECESKLEGHEGLVLCACFSPATEALRHSLFADEQERRRLEKEERMLGVKR